MQELPCVLEYLESDNHMHRTLGFVAMQTVFPHLLAQIAEYSPASSIEDCRKHVRSLRDQMTASPD
jgi:hypothetical protein